MNDELYLVTDLTFLLIVCMRIAVYIITSNTIAY